MLNLSNFFREGKLVLIIVFTGWERVKLSPSIFSGRKRVKIDLLFCGERVNARREGLRVVQRKF